MVFNRAFFFFLETPLMKNSQDIAHTPFHLQTTVPIGVEGNMLENHNGNLEQWNEENNADILRNDVSTRKEKKESA